MQAKSNLPYPVSGFTGREYVGYEWRDVPEGREDEAKRLEAAGVLELKGTAVSEPTDLDDLTIVQLKDMARESELTGFSTMNKAELIAALGDD